MPNQSSIGDSIFGDCIQYTSMLAIPYSGSVALYTTEAEDMESLEYNKNMLWLRSFLFYIHDLVETASNFVMYRTSAISIVDGEIIKAQSSHIDRRFHFIQEQIPQGFVKVLQI